MNVIDKKRNFFIMLLTVLFLAVNIFSPEIANVAGIQSDYGIAYAKGSKGSSGASGGFKSGGFKSSSSYSAPKSSSGGFKSGNFSNAPKSTPKSSSGTSKSSTNPSSGSTKNYSNPSTKSYDSSTKRSIIPIPIPIPVGSNRYYGPSYGNSVSGYMGPTHFIASIVGGIFKFILIIIVFIIILKIIRRSRRRF